MKDPRAFLWKVFQRIRPSFLSKGSDFNFITAHYFWIIGWSILGSILMFATAGGQLAYVDALFLASGANTQAGLNTVDLNTLNLFQQIALYFICQISSPITIHGSVVLLRLYWFEKRFQHIVKEAKHRRVTLSKSRSKSKPTAGDVEKGVNGRHITVMHNTATASRMTNDGTLLENGAAGDDAKPSQQQANGTGPNEDAGGSRDGQSSRAGQPQIKFWDQVKRNSTPDEEDDDEGDVPLPQKRTDEEHIAIYERQRQANRTALRIPGPRDVERGVRPEEFDEDDENVGPLDLSRKESNAYSMRTLPNRDSTRERPATTITIEEPARPWREGQSKHEEIGEDIGAAAHVVSPNKFRKNHVQGEKFKATDTDTVTSSTAPRNPLQRIRTALSQSKEDEDPMPYLTYQPTIGRNSAFVGLTEEEREELGGIEYRSLKTLAVILLIYFWGYSIFGYICLVPWILHNNPHYQGVVNASGVNTTWWAFFTSNSAFMDLGFTLTPDSMLSFQAAIFPLLIMSFLIILGNTGFPVMLRFMIWLSSLFAPRKSGLWEELRFLLDHPRRCFTLLFPSNATWWLFLVLVLLNGLDLLLFIVLDLHSPAVEALPLNVRFLDGWFQATATRTAGFACVNIADLHPAIQTSYLIMMYISVFPIAISVRTTNVYEEKSLGVYKGPEEVDDQNPSGMAYMGSHFRRQLSFDLWYLFVGYFIITISEGDAMQRGEFTMFAALFEVVSAYGTVGLSFGFSGGGASLCSQFSVVGKLVIIAMMIRGRHRGLPYGLDRAVLLPKDNREAEAAAELELLQRRDSAVTTARASSMNRGRSHSISRRRVLPSLMHPGPVYDLSRTKSTAQTQPDNSLAVDPSEMLRKYKSNPEYEEKLDPHQQQQQQQRAGPVALSLSPSPPQEQDQEQQHQMKPPRRRATLQSAYDHR